MIDLDLLPADRREAVATWLATSIGDCTSCGRPVLLTQGRRAEKKGYAHMACDQVENDGAAGAKEPQSAAVEARARRSDWG